MKETERPIALYGTGDGADKIMAKLEKDGTLDKVKGVFASSGFVRDRSFKGFKVESFESCLERLGKDMIVLMCFGSPRPEVLSNVDRIASQCEFYAPDVPVYGKNIFDRAFYEEHRSEITDVTARLEDDLSVKTMVNTVTNKLTGSIEPLKACETTPDEETIKALKNFKYEKNYLMTIRGHVEGHMVLMDLSTGKAYANKAAKHLSDFYEKIFSGSATEI